MSHHEQIRRRKFSLVHLVNAVILLVAAVLPIFVSQSALAAQITARKLTLSDSAGTAAAVTYTFNFTVPSSTVLKSAEAVICTTASGACTTPTGFVNSSSTLSSQPTNLGDASGWTVSTATAGKLRLAKAGNVAAPAAGVVVTFGNVTNPTAQNTTFYARINTYSDAAWTTPVDSGTVAASTAQAITVTASVDETLTFCTGTSITAQDCSTVAGTSVGLGTLTPTSTGSGTSVMAASTNATSGYAITANGATLTSGANTITAMTGASGNTSAQGTEQYGLNLVSNATPSVGSNPTGATGYSFGTGYGTADSFKFVTGQTIVSQAAAAAATTYKVSYVANIASTTKPGSYASTMTYICTATF